ncbi:hypothetical protein CR513_06988, partial [Mucuna pruriens]
SDSIASVLHLAETKSDESLPRPYRLSFGREQLGQCRDDEILYISDSIYLIRVETTKNELYQIGVIVGDTKPGQMENIDRTLKELGTPDVMYQPWCIQYPQLELDQTYELKFGLIHLLPKFHGLAGEDPHKHLK